MLKLKDVAEFVNLLLKENLSQFVNFQLVISTFCQS